MRLPRTRVPRQLSRYTVTFTLIAASAAFADTSKISPDLLPLLSNPSSNVNVIIQYNSAPCSGGLLGGLLCTTVNLLGGVLNVVFSLVNAVAATVQVGSLVSISNQSNVSYIS